MRDKKSDPHRWTADRADAAAKASPDFGEGLTPSRTAVEELRKYPFFFADDDDDERVAPSTTPVAHAELERSAAAPRIPAPLAEIRPLLPQIAPTEERPEAKSKPVAPVRPAASARPAAPKTDATPEADTEVPTPAAASLAERHAAALAHKQAAPIARPEAAVTDRSDETVAVEEEAVAAPRAARATQVAQGPQTEPWYSRVPTGVSLVAVIAYFLIGGIALIGTGLVLGGLGGTLMALFGLVVTAIAAFVAWQELTNTRH